MTTPIWNVRDYWIKIFEIRIDYVRGQWHYLIRKLERSIDLYVRDLSQILLILPLMIYNANNAGRSKRIPQYYLQALEVDESELYR
jgi:hypothetical protein